MTRELITVKEYCKKYKITDAAVRKKITNNKVTSVIYEDITYIVIESNEKEKLKNTIKLKNSKIRELQKERQLYTDQKETIIKLENKLEKLEDKIEIERDKKDKIYDQIFGELSNQPRLIERNG